LPANCVKNIRHPIHKRDAGVFCLVGEQNNCLEIAQLISEQTISLVILAQKK
jgi:hypothetical protein